MSWVITPSNLLVDDQDAMTYLAAVEAADGQALESGVRLAVNAFVKGCKADGIWPAIKASCILAGARTLTGALVPLVGTAPTNFNFVAGDYNRKTGLVGNGSTKYLDSNRPENADPADSYHLSTFVTGVDPRFPAAVNSTHIGVINGLGNGTAISIQADSNTYGWSRSGFLTFINARPTNSSLFGIRRTPINTSIRIAGVQYARTADSIRPHVTPSSLPYYVFAMNNNLTPTSYCQARLSFYSIGESLNLALLDARVTTLINAIAAAIP